MNNGLFLSNESTKVAIKVNNHAHKLGICDRI